MSDRHQKILMLLVGLGVFLGCSGIIAKMVFLRIHETEGKAKQFIASRRTYRELKAARGKILDRNGKILAMDKLMIKVAVDPVFMREQSVSFEDTARILSEHLVQDSDTLNGLFEANSNRRYVPLTDFGNHITIDVADAIRTNKLKGVRLDEELVRFYTEGKTLSQLLGIVNAKQDGVYGIEQRYDKYLKSTPGLIQGERDARQKEIHPRRMVDLRPRRGSDVTLTIDQYTQYIVEKELIAAVEEQGALGGWAILQKVKTGEILAMVGCPSFDPLNFRFSADDTAKTDLFRNRCIGDSFEPGSIFKVAVIAAAFNEGLIQKDQIINCEHGTWHYGGRPLRDYHPYGELSVADVVKKSSNIGSAKIALMLGNSGLYNYLRAFGIGSKTGVELPGEELGLLYPVNKWTAISPTRIAMGHEVAVTALQMLNMMCAVGNNGRLMQPYIVSKVVDWRGVVISEGNPKQIGRPITAQTASLMCTLLARVTDQGGTGRSAALEGYRVAGKTGTAQKPIPGGYSSTLNISSFMGLVPAHAPELGMIVVLDSPKKQRTGGGSAAPVFKRAMQPLLKYYDVPPDQVQLASDNH
ncbi:MAG: penicillin-binding protein 2 [Lentisphaerae bacterium]|nr:penicillin-binding protein 2 [Lentisphaerota bacterium]